MDYQDSDFQILLRDHGSREQMIKWLIWNDPNGTYSDKDSLNEGLPVLTLEDARRLMDKAIRGEDE